MKATESSKKFVFYMTDLGRFFVNNDEGKNILALSFEDFLDFSRTLTKFINALKQHDEEHRCK